MFPKDLCWVPFYINSIYCIVYITIYYKYCSASSVQQAINKLQSAFDVIQSRIYYLKLVMNVDKTKYILFSGSKKIDNNLSSLQTLQGSVIELVRVQISWHYC